MWRPRRTAPTPMFNCASLRQGDHLHFDWVISGSSLTVWHLDASRVGCDMLVGNHSWRHMSGLSSLKIALSEGYDGNGTAITRSEHSATVASARYHEYSLVCGEDVVRRRCGNMDARRWARHGTGFVLNWQVHVVISAVSFLLKSDELRIVE